ncbi:MAG: hypothetical protein RLZZ528_1658 [Pseudomonadota bacterium]
MSDTTRHQILPAGLVLAAIPSVLAMGLILWQTPLRFAPVYYAIVITLGWVFLAQGRWRSLRDRVSGLPGPVWLRAVGLGYGAVIAEETLVGTLAALAEGFAPGLWIERVGQFVLFNLFAFTGAVWGIALLAPRLPLALRHVWVAGLWGLFAERVWAYFPSSPIAGLVLIAPTMAVYAVILAPAMLSVPLPDRRGHAGNVAVALGLMFMLSVGPVLGLFALRGALPDRFPPCIYIACDE